MAELLETIVFIDLGHVNQRSSHMRANYSQKGKLIFAS